MDAVKSPKSNSLVTDSFLVIEAVKSPTATDPKLTLPSELTFMVTSSSIVASMSKSSSSIKFRLSFSRVPEFAVRKSLKVLSPVFNPRVSVALVKSVTPSNTFTKEPTFPPLSVARLICFTFSFISSALSPTNFPSHEASWLIFSWKASVSPSTFSTAPPKAMETFAQ